MAYIVKAFTPGKLNLAPETLEEEVLQNVAIIVSTPKFSVPLDRGLGLAQRFIDKPIQVAQSILISEVLDAVLPNQFVARRHVLDVQVFRQALMPEKDFFALLPGNVEHGAETFFVQNRQSVQRIEGVAVAQPLRDFSRSVDTVIGRVFLPGPVVMRDKANRRNVNTHYKPATPRKNGVIC